MMGVLQVVLQDSAVVLTLPDGRALPRGSLVAKLAPCTAGQIVEVLQLGAYRLPEVALVGVGEQLCVPADILAWPLEVLAEDGRFGELRQGSDGHFRLQGQVVALEALRALEPGEYGALLKLQKDYQRYFGAIPLRELHSSHQGYVALPLWARNEAQLQKASQAEDFVSEEQQEKQITHDGPFVNGVPVYTHFTGTDMPLSDVWGRPEFVGDLLKLLSGWQTECRQWERAERCTVAIGDLAWYNAQRPDPLGHKDHASGDCVDLRLFRKDNSEYEAWWNKADDRPGRGWAYDARLTGRFLSYALHFPLEATVFFNDPQWFDLGVEPLVGHDDHLHLCLNATRLASAIPVR